MTGIIVTITIGMTAKIAPTAAISQHNIAATARTNGSTAASSATIGIGVIAIPIAINDRQSSS